jgi:4'-phosphopantetheinyl transferase
MTPPPTAPARATRTTVVTGGAGAVGAAGPAGTSRTTPAPRTTGAAGAVQVTGTGRATRAAEATAPADADRTGVAGITRAARAPRAPGPPRTLGPTRVVEVADGVWVAWAQGHRPSDHPGDHHAAGGLPAWRRRELLAGRGLLRALLAEFAPWAAGAPVCRRRNGQPVLAGCPDVGVSVSHDGGTVAAAVALGRRVGVDVQQPPEELGDGMLRRCLGRDSAALAALPLPARAREFAWVWSVQESCVKADGTGLAGRPWSVDVPPRPTAGRWRDLVWQSLRDHSDTPLSCAFGAFGESPC